MKFVTPEIAWNYDIEQINSIDFNPKGHRELAVCSSDSTNQGIFLRFWEFDQGLLFSTPQDLNFVRLKYEASHVHQKQINCVRYAPGGDLLASGGDDQKVIVWREKQRPLRFGSKEIIKTWAESAVLA